MPVITIFSGVFCGGEAIADKVAETLEYPLLTDDDIVAQAAGDHDMAADKILKAIKGAPSVFNKFTHARERGVAIYRSMIADMLGKDGLLFLGQAGHLIPPSVGHVLKVCIIADFSSRVDRVVQELKIGEAKAAKLLRTDDERVHDWTEFVLHNEAWNPSLYDIVIPSDKTDPDEAASLIAESAGKKVLQPTTTSIQAVRDFALSAKVALVLTKAGHDVDIDAKDGLVTITIDHQVIMLSRLESELKKLAAEVPGVVDVETKIGPNFYRSDIYRQHDFQTPSKVLLVDDEREFAQTLSERLSMRDVGSAIAYNGEEALSVLEEDEPEVMVLDLKMPGIDGIEVLRRVKRDHPNVEVIILTGHGSKEDEQTCMKLGAYAYFRKPVDIDALSEAMKNAHNRKRSRRQTE